MIKYCRKTGGALPFSLIALVIVTGFIVSVSNLNQGLKSQVLHTSQNQWSFLMAYSIFSRALAKVHSVSWTNRPFATAPYQENNVLHSWGSYDLHMENSPGKEFKVDIYIRTNITGLSRLYFWRVKFNDDLLDVSNRIVVEIFKTGDSGDFPKGPGPSPFSQKIDDLMKKRADNQKNSDTTGDVLSTAKTPEEVIGVLNGRTPKTFTSPFPNDPPDPTIIARVPPPIPIVPPPGNSDIPSATGPGGDIPPWAVIPTPENQGTENTNKGNTPSDGPTGNNYNYPSGGGAAARQQLENTLERARQLSQNANDLANSGRDKVTAGTDITSAEQDFQAANESRQTSFDTMRTAISQSRGVIGDAASLEERKAIEEMVSNTMVAGMQNIYNGGAVQLDSFFNGDQNGAVSGLTTSAGAQSMIDGMTGSLNAVRAAADSMKAIAASMEGYSMTSEAQAKLTEVLDNMKKMEDAVQKAIDEALVKLEELKKKEEEAAAAAAAANDDDDDSGGSQ
ncbi:MAG: hypothetical protein HQM10_11480 [Candidatus Riflebacteria bacterium]|nr:hypothetical protein [Candidatus Riflebacteria bacterium]